MVRGWVGAFSRYVNEALILGVRSVSGFLGTSEGSGSISEAAAEAYGHPDGPRVSMSSLTERSELRA